MGHLAEPGGLALPWCLSNLASGSQKLKVILFHFIVALQQKADQIQFPPSWQGFHRNVHLFFPEHKVIRKKLLVARIACKWNQLWDSLQVESVKGPLPKL